jgi:uncharacterized protein YjgD (DUF1641 family)
MDRKNAFPFFFIAAITIFITSMIPYFLTFNGLVFSHTPDDWGSFGSYLSGICGIINLLVFIIITYYLSRLEERRSEKDLALQKKILISQFRQQELSQISQKLDAVLEINGIAEKSVVLQEILSTSIILTNFVNQKAYLFPILKEEINKQLYSNILDELSQFLGIVNETYGTNLTEYEENAFEKKLQAYIFMKNEFIEKLQIYILKDLD